MQVNRNVYFHPTILENAVTSNFWNNFKAKTICSKSVFSSESNIKESRSIFTSVYTIQSNLIQLTQIQNSLLSRDLGTRIGDLGIRLNLFSQNRQISFENME